MWINKLNMQLVLFISLVLIIMRISVCISGRHIKWFFLLGKRERKSLWLNKRRKKNEKKKINEFVK